MARPVANASAPPGPHGERPGPLVSPAPSRPGRPRAPSPPESPPVPLALYSGGAVVIPCYNHGPKLAAVVSEIRSVAPTLPIVVVDDGSDPRVEPIPGVEILRHPTNRGKGEAILTGVHHFLDRDFLILLDADGQHPAGEIPRLMEEFARAPKADVVTASRDLVHDPSIPMRHRVANLVLAFEFAMLNGRFFPDVTNGFRILRTRSFLALDTRFRGYEIEIETLSAVLKNGLLVRTVPTRGIRYDGPSSIGRGIKITATLAISMFVSKFRPRHTRDVTPRDAPVGT